MRRGILILLATATAAAAAPLLADEGAIPLYEPAAITAPGQYILTRDISAASGPILDIRTDGVWIRGNGHTLSLSGAAGPVVQISADVSGRGVLLQEMVLEGGQQGVADNLPGGGGVRLTLERVTLTGASETGIALGSLARLKAEKLRVICHGGTAINLKGVPGGALPTASFFDVFLEAAEAVRIDGARTALRRSEVRSCQRAVELTSSPSSLMAGSLFTSPGSDVCFQPQPEPPGIWLSGCGGSSIRNSVFRGSDRRGVQPSPFIELVDSGGVTITANLIQGAGSSAAGNFGIAANAASDDTLIAGNSITGCGDAGVRVLSSGNAIRENLVDRNQAAGIFVGGTNNLVDGNRVGHNSGDGIYFDNDSGPHVYRDNVLRGNTGGPIGGSETNTDGGGNIY